MMNFSTTQLPYLINTDHLLDNLEHLTHRVALESSNFDHPNGRWSIISASPAQYFYLDNRPDLESAIKQIQNLQGQLPTIESDLPFTGGLIGHISYDLGMADNHPADLSSYSNQPLLICGLYSWAFIIDHTLQQSHLVYWTDISSLSKQVLLSLFNDALKPSKSRQSFKLTKPFQARWDKDGYKARINKILEYILSGDTYQVNLAQSFHASYSGSVLDAYSKLKASSNVPFASYFEFNGSAFASASPELFIKLSDNVATTKPIKGTRPRIDDQKKDTQQVELLKNSPKDKAENLMIVDLLRNDLSKNASNVSVEALFEVETFSTVHHLVSTITAHIKDDHAVSLLFDAFPGGSITGAPKKRAMEIINELEQAPRSFYCGSSFYFSSNKKMSSNILIRGFLFEDNNVTCWAGGGIVADSNWEDEYQESLDKISKLMDALS